MKNARFDSPLNISPRPKSFRLARIIFSSLIIMAIMSWFCAMTPWISDDYGFSKNDGGLFATQVEEYLTWSGKFIGHFMSRVLLSGPKWVHPVLTPIMFMLLVTGGSLLAIGSQWRKKLKAWHLVVVAGLVWIALPAFGTVFFWRTGTPDYGYSLVWATLFLVPYRMWADRADFSLPGGAAYVIAGILAGWSNENVGMLALLVAMAVTLYRWRTSRKVPMWAVAGITGAAFGWGMMMAAPGNAVRLAVVGGVDKIPLLSMDSMLRFLQFWSTEQLEMLPYFLTALVLAWILRRRGQLTPAVWIPAVAFFLMAQASLGAFIFSPSTPYRAMSATFFFAALCPFSLLVALDPASLKAKALFMCFCGLLLSSVLIEARVFLMAQPYFANQHPISLSNINYPETDKYFFPGYDIRELNLYSDHWTKLVPWDEARTLRVDGQAEVRALVACNIVFLDKLPQGEVHVAAKVRTAKFSSLLQQAVRTLLPKSEDGTNAAISVILGYFPASGNVLPNGMAAVFIPGIKSIDDIAYMAVQPHGNSMIWRRVTPANSQN